MTYNYHHHDHGLGRLLSRGFWTVVAFVIGWWFIVLVMSFPWIMLLFGGMIVMAALVIALALAGSKGRTPHE